MQLNPDVLCADSLPGMKEIFENMTEKESKKRKKTLEKFDINAEIVVATELFNTKKIQNSDFLINNNKMSKDLLIYGYLDVWIYIYMVLYLMQILTS